MALFPIPFHTLAFLALFHAFDIVYCQSFIGVNYGQVADNLPPPLATARLLQSTFIEKVRLYGSDPAIIKALANTGIGIVIGAANGDIPTLASDPNFAKNWINSNVIPFYPASNIILITVGNEVMTPERTGGVFDTASPPTLPARLKTMAGRIADQYKRLSPGRQPTPEFRRAPQR